MSQPPEEAILGPVIEDSTTVIAVTDESNERSIDMFRFSPDGSKIAFVSADEKTPEQRAREQNGEDVQVWGYEWPYARLRIVDVATKERSPLGIRTARYRRMLEPEWTTTSPSKC